MTRTTDRSRTVLLPDEPAVHRALAAVEDVLVALALQEQHHRRLPERDTPLVFPDPLHHARATDAMRRATDAVLSVLRARDPEYGDGDGEEDQGPWLLAADGGRMTPVRRLELAVSDLEQLDAAVVAAVRALAEPPTTPDPAVGVLLDEVGDLRQALHTMAVDPDRGLGRRTTPRELVGILARAVLLLTLPDDADTAVLGRLVREQTTDLTLTAAQQQAHQRLCARCIRLLNDPAPEVHYTV